MEKIKASLQSLFDISEAELTVFLSAFTKKEFVKNERFLERGVVCHKVGLIEKGLMMCVYERNGNEVLDEFSSENNFITNYYSFLTDSPSEKEIRCIEDCTVHVIYKHQLEKLGEQYPFIERMARIINEQLFLRGHERIKSLLLDSASERYRKEISKRPDLVQRIPQYLLASYLNVKPETISRIRKKYS